MHVKRKYGKNEIEVNGTEEQIDRAIKQWQAELKSQEPMVQVCVTIRQMAENMGWEDAKDASILSLIQRFAGMRDLPKN